MKQQFALTHHAVEQFQKRIVPDHDYEQAKTLLVNRSQFATHLKIKSANGHSLWKIESPDAILVAKHNEYYSSVHERNTLIVATILKPEFVFDDANIDICLNGEFEREAEEIIIDDIVKKLKCIRAVHNSLLEGQRASYLAKSRNICCKYDSEVKRIMADVPLSIEISLPEPLKPLNIEE